MTVSTPQTHQELLEAHIEASRKVSSEFSGDIRGDAWRLWTWAREYAEAQALVAPTSPEVYGIYYPADDDERAELGDLYYEPRPCGGRS